MQAESALWPVPVYGLGASHLQSNFVIFTGLGSRIAALVDDDPAKAGRHISLPEPVPVISTSALEKAPRPGTILLTAFGHRPWMERTCARVAGPPAMIVDPLALMRQF